MSEHLGLKLWYLDQDSNSMWLNCFQLSFSKKNIHLRWAKWTQGTGPSDLPFSPSSGSWEEDIYGLIKCINNISNFFRILIGRYLWFDQQHIKQSTPTQPLMFVWWVEIFLPRSQEGLITMNFFNFHKTGWGWLQELVLGGCFYPVWWHPPDDGR